MILDMLYVSFAVNNVNDSRRAFRDRLALPSERMPPDSFLGSDDGARIAFPNKCCLYIVESQQRGSPIYQFLDEKGPGLERIAFRSDDIEREFERVRSAGIPLKDGDLKETPTGLRFAVPSEHVSGVTVEVLQPSPGCWVLDPPRSIAGVLGLQHIGVATHNLTDFVNRFAQLFDLSPSDLRGDQHGGQQKDVIFKPGNDRLWLHVVESWEPEGRVGCFVEERGEGLEHICVEVDDIRESVKRVLDGKCSYEDNPFLDRMIYTSRPDGFEAFIRPDLMTGLTVELIEPFPFSRGYRERRC